MVKNVKNKEQEFLKFKYALALKKILESNKKQKEFNLKNGIENLNLDYSYATISSTTGLRPATISNIISGISEMKIYTLDLILGSLGVYYTEFGKILDKLSEEEILKYKVTREKERAERIKNKSSGKKMNRKK
jgi:transcriptional regulator with XRE-family HTH domain